jgi:hypothetical protein
VRAAAARAPAADDDAKPLGGEREVVWDSARLARLDGAWLELHPPKFREVALTHDAPWEGGVCCYHTVFKDGDLCRMYYRGAGSGAGEFACYAESDDGITWRKPNLGLFAFRGNKNNNIVWTGLGSHNFAPFRDDNPACPPDQRYKAVGCKGDATAADALLTFASADAIHWRKLSSSPAGIGDGEPGLKFDSQNVVFWDAAKKKYIVYYRAYFKGSAGKGIRGIKIAESADFKKWSEGRFLDYQNGAPEEDLYTNAIIPYSRAAGVYVGFPKRLVLGRGKPWDTSGVYPAVSDGMFMTSRDGKKFYRWPEAFVRPGLQHERWVNRNNMAAWGIVETAGEFPGTPRELSLYSTENYYSDSPDRLRRLTVRLDGFVSARAGAAGGTATTKPLTFSKTTSFSSATGSALPIGAVRGLRNGPLA